MANSDDVKLPEKLPYHCAARPSIYLNPKQVEANPLTFNFTYHVAVYDKDAPVPNDEFHHPRHLHKANWLSAGTVVFNGGGKSLHFAGHAVNEATWNPAKSLVVWSDQPGRARHGWLNFSDDRLTALGIVHDHTGQAAIVSLNALATYTTERWADNLPTKRKFATLTYGSESVNGVLKRIVWLDFDEGMDPIDHEDGGRDDISNYATVTTPGFGDPVKILKTTGLTLYPYTFDIQLPFTLDTFKGTYVDSLKKTWYWEGKSTSALLAAIPPVSPKLSSHPLFGTTALESVDAISIEADADPAPSLNALLKITSTVAVKIPDGGYAVKDWAQENANEIYQRILLTTLPEETKRSLFPNLKALSTSEKTVLDSNREFFNTTGVPYLAQYLDGNEYVSQADKNHINTSRIDLFWKAIGSFNPPPAPEPDPVKEYNPSWARDRDPLKALQANYTQQNLETYRLGYATGVPAFVPYLNDPKNWHDQLSTYLTSNDFLATWGSLNADPGYTNGQRQLYEWQAQLYALQKAAEQRGLKVTHNSNDVLNALAEEILIPSFDSVNWTDEMRQQFELQVQSIMGYTKEELDKIQKENLEKYETIMVTRAGVQVTGTTNAFSIWIDALFRSIMEISLYKDAIKLKAQEVWGTVKNYWRALIQSGGADYRSEEVKYLLGGEIDYDMAERIWMDQTRLQLWQEKVTTFKAKVWGTLGPVVYAAGVAGVIYAIVQQKDILNPLELIQLTGIALEMFIKSMASLAATKLGVWLGENIFSKTGVGRTLAEWFTEKGIARSAEGSVLAKFFGTSSADFLLNRLGPVMSLVAVGVSIWQLVDALQDGTRTDVIYASINLALAVIDSAVIFIGVLAKSFPSLEKAGAACGVIGAAIAIIGLVVAIISLFVKDNPAPPTAPTEFINGPLKTAGFYKS